MPLFVSPISALAAEAAKIDGVSRVLSVERAENVHPLAAVLEPQITKAVVSYSHLFRVPVVTIYSSSKA